MPRQRSALVALGLLLAAALPAGAACVTSAGSWKNIPLAPQAGAFTVEFDATPARAGIDGVLGLSRAAAAGYASLAAIVRFNSSGRIDARNGGAYAAAASIPYSAGLTYRFRLAVNVPARTYSAYVRAPGASERLLGSNYAFRTEQRSVASLGNMGLYASAGSETACTVAAADTTPPAVSMTAPAAGALIAGSVPVSATASDDVAVAGVQFKLDGANLGAEDTAAPFTAPWSSAQAADGAHTLTAVARDAAGNAATSAAVPVTVDNRAPAISGVAASQLSSTTAVVSWTTDEPSDSQADYGATSAYGASSALAPAPVTSHSVALSGLSAGTLYHFRARSKDAAGNAALSGDFAFATASPPPAPAPAPGCSLVGAAWHNAPFAARTGAFTAEFDAVPSGAAIDGVLGLSNGPASGYASLAAIVRFNSSGLIDARNGSAYAASARIPYAAGSTHRFRLEVNLAAHTYSAYVRAAGGAEQLLASGFAFRSEQASVGSLGNLGAYASSGNETVCVPTVSAPSADATPPTVSITAPASGATVSGAVGVTASASDDVALAGVQFLLDGSPLGPEDASAPFSTSWNSAAASNASHVLTAVARDAAGNRTTSAPVPVTVANATTAGGYDQAILRDRPVLFLGMDTPDSGAQVDLSGHGNNGVYKGGTPASATLPNGDKAASFNGSSQYLTVAASPALSVPASGALTIESWIRPSTLQFPRTENEGFVYFLGKGNPADGYEYANRMYSLSNSANRPNRISDYAWNTSGGLGSGAYFQDPVSTSQWILVTDVINMRDRSSSYPTGYISIYKNGVLRGKVRLDQYDVVPGTTQSPFNVGTRNYNSWFQGAVGKVAVYDYELSAAQIAAHYAAMTAAPGTAADPPSAEPVSQEFRAPQRFLSPALADGVNDAAVFGPRAAEVRVFDAQGREVFHAARPAGGSPIVWNGRDAAGRLVESGVYIARVKKDDGETSYQSFAIVK
ncbi:MAG: hypothetical protein HY554_08070 [Elusimicrobia bacterium]|nr:hypothetical protein [Elusimicrobiota bacterium]